MPQCAKFTISAVGLMLVVASASASIHLPPDLDPALLKLQIALDKEAYEVGEPITVAIAITNLSKGQVDFSRSSDETGRFEGYTFAVTTRGGQALPYMDYFRSSEALGSPVHEQPGDTYHQSIVANYQIPVLQPGDYTFKVTFAVGSNEHSTIGSAAVPLHILPTTDAQLKARIEALERRLAAGEAPENIAPLLGMTGSTMAIPPLVELLQNPDLYAQYPAGSALEMIDKEAVKKAVLDSMKEHGPRQGMVRLLAFYLRMQDDAMADAFAPWLKDPDPDRRAAALDGLVSCSEASGRGDVRYNAGLAGLKDDAPQVREVAADLVGISRRPGALAALLPLLEDPNERVRISAVIGVSWQVTPESADALIGVLDHQKGDTAGWAGFRLAAMGGDKAEKAIGAALARSEDKNLRSQIELGREQTKYFRQYLPKGF